MLAQDSQPAVKSMSAPEFSGANVQKLCYDDVGMLFFSLLCAVFFGFFWFFSVVRTIKGVFLSY